MWNIIKQFIAITLISVFSASPVVFANSDHQMLLRSGLRLDFDGVDEAGKSGDNPTGNTNTVGSLACWVTFDDTLASNKINIFFGMGGDATDQATNFGQLSFGRRFATGIDNKLEILQRVDASAQVNRVYGNTTLSAGTYFLSVTSSGTAWKLYVNGAEESLTVVAGANNGNWFGDIGTVWTRHYAVGNSWRDGAWGTSWVNGKIDNCFTTSNELTSSQMLSLYNTGRPIHPCAIITCSNVNVFYKLGEDANGTVTTMHAAIGNPSTDNFTMENMENADIVTTSYY